MPWWGRMVWSMGEKQSRLWGLVDRLTLKRHREISLPSIIIAWVVVQSRVEHGVGGQSLQKSRRRTEVLIGQVGRGRSLPVSVSAHVY